MYSELMTLPMNKNSSVLYRSMRCIFSLSSSTLRSSKLRSMVFINSNCFIIYTRSEFTDFAFRIFSIFFYFVYVFIFALSADYFFKNIYF
jgi:hypothetical protein